VTDNDWRNARIEEVFEDEWYRLDGVTEPERHRRALKVALAVFEKALGEATVIPTDDEREELALLIDPNALELHAYPFPLDAADRVLAAGFRRTEVQGEPSDAQVEAIRELESEIPDAYVQDDMDGPVIILSEQAAKTALAALRDALSLREGGVR